MITYEIEVEDTGQFDKQLKSFEEHVKEQAIRAVKESTEELFFAVKENISKEPQGNVAKPYDPPFGHFYVLKTVHDHPFAQRHGRILPHDREPYFGTHEVSGQMRSSLERDFLMIEEVSIWEFYGAVGWDENVISSLSPPYTYAPGYILDVLEGNAFMLPRPVLSDTANQIKLDEKFHKKLKSYLGVA